VLAQREEMAMDQRGEASRERDFCTWLRQARTERDLTQEALAEAVGCAEQTVRAFESGRRRPSREMAARLADILRLPIQERDLFVRLARAPLAQPLTTGLPEAALGPAHPGTPAGPRGQIQLPPDALIGRHADLERLRQALLVDGRRLVTVLGPGGIGKTRLALQAAADLASHYDDGAAFVALAPLTDAVDVATTIAGVLGCPLPAAQSPEQALLAFLRDRALLLVLDNVEHLLGPGNADGISALLANLLREAPEVTVLCTSRERLHLRAEAMVELDGLGLPADERPGSVERADATLLFLERARQVVDSFALTPENRRAVAQICRLLGGAPLGIELAATWVRVMSCAEIVAEMEQSIDFLALDDRDLPKRHRSLRAVIDHSWQLLTPDEQRLLVRFSVFRGGFRREAAAAICADERALGAGGGQVAAGIAVSSRFPSLLPLLSALVDKSLLRRTPDYDGGTRYDLHEVVRQYLEARLGADAAAAAETQRLHARYYARWLAGQDGILKSARQREAQQAIAAEMGNVRAMWRWAVQEPDVAMVRQAAETLHWFYEVCGWNAEGRAMFSAAAEALRVHAESASSPSDDARVTYWLLVSLEGWYTIRSNPAEGLPRLYAGLEGQRTTGDPLSLAYCLVRTAYVQIFIGAYASAEALLDETEAICEEGGYIWLLSVARVVRGVLETLRSDPETARRFLHAALATAREVGDPRHVSLTLNYLALAALSLGQADEAERVCAEALAIAQAHADRFQTSLALQSLGRVALARGGYEEAEALIDEGRAIAREIGDHWLEAQALGYLGQLAMARGDAAAARAHHRSALQEASSVPQPIALDALAVLADLELAAMPDAALTALAYVRQHPLSRPAARALAEQRWRDVWRELPAERCVAAETAAKSFPPDRPAALLALFGREIAPR
jgi:predicted ATPase/DNA-binding XRE family transcriptional regulator